MALITTHLFITISYCMSGRFHNGTYSVREFQRLLRDNGFEFVRQKNGHRIYRRGNETLSLPTHSAAQTTLHDLIKQYNLKRRDK